jgi:hypothetical protein
VIEEIDVLPVAVKTTNLVLVLDCSKSMNAQLPATGNAAMTRLEKAKAGMLELLDALEKRGNVRVALIAFAHRAEFAAGDADNDGQVDVIGPANVHPFEDYEVLVNLDSQSESAADHFARIRAQLAQIKSGKGFTPLYFTLLKAAELLEQDPKNKGGEIVVLTDGVNFQGQGRYQPPNAVEITTEVFEKNWKEKYADDIRLQLVLFHPSAQSFESSLEAKGAKLREELKTASVEQRSVIEAQLRFVELIEAPRFVELKQMVAASDDTMRLLEARNEDFSEVEKQVLENLVRPSTNKIAAVKIAEPTVSAKEGRFSHTLIVEVLIGTRPLATNQEPEIGLLPDDGTSERDETAANLYQFTGLKSGVPYKVSGEIALPLKTAKGSIDYEFPKEATESMTKKVQLILK